MARTPSKPSATGEVRRQSRRQKERLRRLEIEERPAGGSGGAGSVYAAMFWRDTNQTITGTASGSDDIEWNRSEGDASIVIDGSDASKILVPEPGSWRAVFTGRADMTAGALSTGKLRASIGWRDNGNDQHWVGQLCPVLSAGDSDWSVVTPPIVIPAVTGGSVTPQPYFHAELAFVEMTNPGTLSAFGQDDSQLDGDGYPTGVDVMRFSLERVA